MNSLFEAIFHPVDALDRWFNKDGEGFDAFYPLTVFFAFGIWLVVDRYQHMHNRPIPFEHTTPPEASPQWDSKRIVNPHLRSYVDDPDLLPSIHHAERDYITSFDPATGLHMSTYLADNADEIRRKIQLAANAQEDWRETTFTKRRRVVRSLMKWLVENQRGCAQVACRDTGKTLVDAALGEIMTTCAKMEWLIKRGEYALKPETRWTPWMLFYKKSQVHYEPLGVVAAIVSWNYPLHNAWSPILASIFAGNGVVLKCSEKVIWSSTWFVNAIRRCLEACGHNPDLVQLVCCWPEDAEALTASPMIKHITFIGSETVGRKVAKAATTHLTPVTLELGGKDPAIILPDTDLQKWAPVWMRGVFQNAGQNCIGIERLIVHRDQHDNLCGIMRDGASKLRLGSVLTPTPEGYVPPVDCGAMIDSVRFQDLERLVQDAKNDGAQLHGGGKHWQHVYHENGAYFAATVVGLADNRMEIAQTEVFAPVALIIPYDTVEEAVDIANGTRYGLGASVFGPDQERCLEVAAQLECGMVAVNDFAVFYMNQDLPFGGTKASGYGRFGGPEGLRALTNPKVIIVDRWPWLIQTSIPKALHYPIRSLSQSWEFINAMVNALYADDWRTRLRNVVVLIGASE